MEMFQRNKTKPRKCMSSKAQDQLKLYPQDAQGRDSFFSPPNCDKNFKVLFSCITSPTVWWHAKLEVPSREDSLLRYPGIHECGGFRLNSIPKFMIYPSKKPALARHSIRHLTFIMFNPINKVLPKDVLFPSQGRRSCPRDIVLPKATQIERGGIQLQVYPPTKTEFFPLLTLPPQALLFVLPLVKQPRSLVSERAKMCWISTRMVTVFVIVSPAR